MNSNHNPNQSRIRRTVAAVLIAAALVVGVGVFLVARCLSFDEDGAHVIDRYGVLAQESQQDTQQPAADEPDGQPEDEPEDEPEEAYSRMIVLAADEAAQQAERVSALAQRGALDTVIVDIKDADGALRLAVDTGELDDAEQLVDGDADALAAAIAGWRDAGTHVIGRIYCLHDAQATRRNSDLAIQFERGGTWLDYDNTRWLDPTNGDAVDYLCDIAASAVEAGCGELLLADFTFPPRGHLDRADFDRDPDDQASVLLDALEEIRRAADGVPVSLTADTLSGLTELSVNGAEDGIPAGDTAALLAAAERLFVPADGADSARELLDAARAEEWTLVPLLTDGDAWLSFEGAAALDGAGDAEAALDLAENRLDE